jgi:hypothetical protein
VANTEYLELEEVTKLADIRDGGDDEPIVGFLIAASRAIDDHCGRYFYQDDDVTLRTFRAVGYNDCIVDDISTADGLIVATDDDDDGTAENEWTVDTDFYLRPTGGRVNGRTSAYTRVAGTGARWFPFCGYREQVHVTARWGWPEVPEPVQQACGILTLWLWKMKDAPLGAAGFDQFGQIRVREHPAVALLLAPYRRDPLPVA